MYTDHAFNWLASGMPSYMIDLLRSSGTNVNWCSMDLGVRHGPRRF